MRRFAKADPLILLVAGVVVVLGALGLFARLGLSPDQVAQLEAGVIMIVSALRIWLGRRAPAGPPQQPSEIPTPKVGIDARN